MQRTNLTVAEMVGFRSELFSLVAFLSRLSCSGWAGSESIRLSALAEVIIRDGKGKECGLSTFRSPSV